MEGWCGGSRDRGHLQDGEGAVEPGMRERGGSGDSGGGGLVWGPYLGRASGWAQAG